MDHTDDLKEQLRNYLTGLEVIESAAAIVQYINKEDHVQFAIKIAHPVLNALYSEQITDGYVAYCFINNLRALLSSPAICVDALNRLLTHLVFAYCKAPSIYERLVPPMIAVGDSFDIDLWVVKRQFSYSKHR